MTATEVSYLIAHRRLDNRPVLDGVPVPARAGNRHGPLYRYLGAASRRPYAFLPTDLAT